MKFVLRAASLLLALAVGGCASSGVDGAEPFGPKRTETLRPIEAHVFPAWYGAIDGDRLAYRDDEGLKVVDLANGERMASIPLDRDHGFDISGDFVVWSDWRNEERPMESFDNAEKANADVFLYDLSSGETRQLTTDVSAQVQPKIWGTHVVWMDNRTDPSKEYPSHWQVMLHDLATGESKTITRGKGGHTAPDIDGGYVVWEDGREVGKRGLRAGGNVPDNDTNIYMYRIEDGETKEIAAEGHKEGLPRVSGGVVVWEAYDDSYQGDVFAYVVSSGERYRLTARDTHEGVPVANGKTIAWMDERNGTSTHDIGLRANSDIYLLDMESGTEYLVSGPGPQIRPELSERWIVFGLSTDGEPELHALRYR